MPVFLALALPAAIGTAARWVLAGLATGIGAGAADEIKDFVVKKGKAALRDYGEQFIASAAADMGLELSENGHLTDESITAAVNKLLAGTGIQIDSLLDRDRLRAGLERAALKALADEVGLPDGTFPSVAGIRGALQEWAAGQVMEQVTSGAGPLMDAATASPKIANMIEKAAIKPGWNTPTDMSKEGVDNRLRQAKYRARHKKQWVPK